MKVSQQSCGFRNSISTEKDGDCFTDDELDSVAGR